MSTKTVALTRFAGRAGDHNDRAMVASGYLTSVLAKRLARSPLTIGKPAPALSRGWREELESAQEDLRAMARRYDTVLGAGDVPVTALSRCAVGLATLPVVAAHRPDAVVIWFDAHADLNTPAESTSGYLGGMALSSPLGRWDSGFGSGLTMDRTILVGARDLDPPEQRLVDEGSVALVGVGPAVAADLAAVVDGRPVYVHLDCDVLEPGTVPTDYLVPGGLTLAQLRNCAVVLARSEVVGIEIGELETSEQLAGDGGLGDPLAPARAVVGAWKPVFAALSR